MRIEQTLIERSAGVCELCGSAENLAVYTVAGGDGSADGSIYACATCRAQIDNPADLDTNHWRCLGDAMWSGVPAVQVVAYRLYHAMGAQDQIDMMYMEEDLKAWADSGLASADDTPSAPLHRDSNGTVLTEGDSVTLIKDLDVKGAGFTAKRGTIVKPIHLTDDPKYIEGKINGQVIVIVAAFTKKA